VTVEQEEAAPAVARAALFEVEHDRLARFAYLLTGSSAVAEDVVQDAFVQLHRRWETVRQPGAYLRTAVVNGCRGYHRKQRREQSYYPELLTATVLPETPVVLDALVRLPYRQRAARSSCGSTRTGPTTRSQRSWAVGPPRCVR
jgi:DNA-directed RNA polymerase specialized sigma24 family protein